ncbi:hypothetical protein BKA81DRAFT_428681 [Phyllosticta paracitricarpa]
MTQQTRSDHSNAMQPHPKTTKPPPLNTSTAVNMDVFSSSRSSAAVLSHSAHNALPPSITFEVTPLRPQAVCDQFQIWTTLAGNRHSQWPCVSTFSGDWNMPLKNSSPVHHFLAFLPPRRRRQSRRSSQIRNLCARANTLPALENPSSSSCEPNHLQKFGT